MKTRFFFPAAIALAAAFAFSADTRAQTPVVLAGTARWTDTCGSPHPVRFAHVEAVNARTGRAIGAPDTTDALGAFALTVPPGTDPVFARVFARTADVRVQQGNEKRDYAFDGPARSGATTSPPVVLTTSLRTEKNGAFSILDALTFGRQYAATLDPKPLAPVLVRYPATRNAYDWFRNVIEIRAGDHLDWDVVMHEYGHHTGSQLGVDLTPGGNHKPWLNLAQGSVKPEDQLYLAWSEGLATFFSISSQRALALSGLGIPRVDDGRYTDAGNAGQDYALDGTGEYKRLGQDNTAAVARILYDLFDPAQPGSEDPAWVRDSVLWQRLRAAGAQVLTGAWQALKKGSPTEIAEIGSVFGAHGAAARLVAPKANAMLQQGAPEFRWEAPTGYPLHDCFAVEIFDAQGRYVWQSPGSASLSYTPSAEEWVVVRAAKAPLSWIVHAWRSDAPLRGYVSGARHLQPSSLIEQPLSGIRPPPAKQLSSQAPACSTDVPSLW